MCVVQAQDGENFQTTPFHNNKGSSITMTHITCFFLLSQLQEKGEETHITCNNNVFSTIGCLELL